VEARPNARCHSTSYTTRWPMAGNSRSSISLKM
jgi:hypothetical protein